MQTEHLPYVFSNHEAICFGLDTESERNKEMLDKANCFFKIRTHIEQDYLKLKSLSPATFHRTTKKELFKKNIRRLTQEDPGSKVLLPLLRIQENENDQNVPSYAPTVIVKSGRHFRINNERDVLQRFQDHTPFLRPLLDEIVEPNDTPAIVLKYLEDHLLHASVSERLSKDEIKYVSKGVLQALNVLHQEGFVHTDVKPDNVLVNYGPENNGVRFTDVQLADCGSTVPAASEYAKDGYMIGAPIWRSPEAQLGIGWRTSTDIWSFGTMLITLLYGGDFFLFKPDVPAGLQDYEMKIVEKQSQYFGPFPIAYQVIAPSATLNVLMGIMRGLKGKQRPFTHISEKELSKKDKEFILRIMKLDPRETPSAQDLKNDEWFSTWMLTVCPAASSVIRSEAFLQERSISLKGFHEYISTLPSFQR